MDSYKLVKGNKIDFSRQNSTSLRFLAPMTKPRVVNGGV